MTEQLEGEALFREAYKAASERATAFHGHMLKAEARVKVLEQCEDFFKDKADKAEARVRGLEEVNAALKEMLVRADGERHKSDVIEGYAHSCRHWRGRALAAEARVKALEALCAEAVLRQYSGEWPSWFTTKLSAAGQGKEILPRGLVKGPSGDLTEAEVKEILTARPSDRRAIEQPGGEP